MVKYRHYVENATLREIGMSVRAYNYCLARGIHNVRELLDYYCENNHSIPAGQNAGLVTISEISAISYNLLKIKKKIEKDSSTTPRDKDSYRLEKKTQAPQINCTPCPTKASSAETKTLSGFKSYITEWGLSTRAYNFCQKNRLTTRDALLFYYISHDYSIPKANNCGDVTVRELESLCKSLIQSSGEEPQPHIVSSIAEAKSPFEALLLNEDDIEAVENYKKENGHYPILRIISDYILADESVSCFAAIYGIDERIRIKSISELASLYQVSPARIGQRINQGYGRLFGPSFPLLTSIKKVDYSYLKQCYCNKDYLTSTGYNTEINTLNKAEGAALSNSFILRFLSCLFQDYQALGCFERNKPNPEIVLIHDDICRVFDFGSFCSTIDELIKNATNVINLNIREYVEDSPHWIKFSFSMIGRVVDAAKSYLLIRHGLYEEQEEDIFQIIPKSYHYEEIVYSIISKENAPLTLPDILRIGNKQFPLSGLSEDKIKLAIRNDKRIVTRRGGALGPMYMLATNNTPTSIRDAAVRILDSCEYPVKLDDIVSYVLGYFPTSSKNSIRTSLLSDDRGRFQQYEDGRYGLASKTYSEDYRRVADSARLSYADKLIKLKAFLADNKRFPSVSSRDDSESFLAKWMERDKDKPEVKGIINTFSRDIWKNECLRCEKFIVSHNGKLPSKEKTPDLYQWLFNSSIDMREDRLDQEQRRMFMHLRMQIRQ